MVLWNTALLALCVVCRVASNDAEKPGRWGSPYSHARLSSGRNVFEQRDSIAAFVASVRGGSDPFYGDYSRRKGPGRYGYDDYSQGDYYGQDDDSQDDGDGDDEDSYYNQAYRHRRSDYDTHDDRRRSSVDPTTPDVSSIFNSLPSVVRNGDRRIGSGLLVLGALITMLGMSFLFNKALMRLGNLLFIAGVPMMVGPSRTMGFFLQPEKFRATACLGLGIFLVFVGSPVFGIALEIFGLLNLFGNMFPVVMALAKGMPFIGPILSGNRNGGSNNRYRSGSRGRRSQDPYDDDPYYYDDRTYDGYYQDDGRRDDDRYYY